MKQPLVLAFGLTSMLLPPVLMAYFEVDHEYFIFVFPLVYFGLMKAISFEKKNIAKGEINPETQSKGNKVLTYTLALLVLLVLVLPILIGVISDLYELHS
ncbi:hypothetical protein [Thalassomonas haliotis]|uniref:Uncharacterized protein n=1 Tax=Thalassomonas haliotis TaxID=485448 RepID=A0ABY7VC15_9GAMM|nr:hypothetical protein [Thalassomonas haliotis]WDE10644.1 hypothetical protein H3N35_20650 [Thalassomonas haliotis]